MTKKAIAMNIAAHMNKINNNVEIKRMANVLINSMTKEELEKALRSFEA